MLPGMPAEAGSEEVSVPGFFTRLHPLASDVKCRACGAGLPFIMVTIFGDLYQWASDRGKRQVMHYRRKESRTCGYAVMYSSGAFGVWTACGEGPAKRE